MKTLKKVTFVSLAVIGVAAVVVTMSLFSLTSMLSETDNWNSTNRYW